MTETPNINLIATTTLEQGPHEDKLGVCAMEIFNLALGLEKSDHVPDCAPAGLAILPKINDWHGWTSDGARTEFLRPYLLRFLTYQRDPAKDQIIAFRHADYVVRVIAARALDRAGLSEQAAKLRTLTEISSVATAEAVAARAARAAVVAATKVEAAAAEIKQDFAALLDIICAAYAWKG